MNKAKLVKKIIGSEVGKLGFVWQPAERNLYSYLREEGELKQIIWISVVHEKYLKMYLMTNAYGQESVNVGTLVPKGYENLDSSHGKWKWENEEDFVRILEMFKKILVERGINKLNEISVPTTEERPTTKAQRMLYEEHERLNEEYRIKLGLEDKMPLRLIAGRISEAVLATKNMDFSKAEYVLMGIAAVLGTEIVKKCGGEWKWQEGFVKLCWIDNIGGNKNRVVSPLKKVYWYRDAGKEDILYLMNLIQKGQ